MREWMQTAVLKALLGMIRVSPRPLVSVYARFLALVLTFLARKDIKRILTNIHLAYGLPTHSKFAKTFARQVLYHQVHGALETMKASFDPQSVEINGVDAFNAAVRENLAAGKGVIVVTGHMGSWEFVGHASANAAGGFHALAKPAKLDALTKELETMRGRFGIKVLWSNKKSLIRDMLEVLKSGKALGFVMDQKPEGRVGPVVDFFGQPTEFVGGPASVSMKTGCAVMAVFCMREGPWRYRIIYKTVAPPLHGFKEPQDLTQMMAREIEEVIRLYPEQWAWNYRRWKKKPQPQSEKMA